MILFLSLIMLVFINELGEILAIVYNEYAW
jgi:hypothetical protein